MKTYKTTSGLFRAAKQFVANLESSKIGDHYEYLSVKSKFNNFRDQLDVLWSNPADKADADAIRVRLADAWHLANN